MSQVPSPEQAHAEATQWTLHGISLLDRGDQDALLEAQTCFEQAISLRENLPLDQNPLFRWGLTAGWMNRADALTRLGGPDRLQEALRSYDIAIAHLHQLPLDKDLAFRWRLSVAWMNRGLTQQALPNCQEETLRCFDTAIQVMQGHENCDRWDYQQAQASTWMNRANALLALPSPDWPLAAASARRAIQHSRLIEDQDPIAAEAGIKARHTLCRCLAHLLESPPISADQGEAWILEATDAVEDVMNLTKNNTNFHELRDEMFAFGCRIYRAFQPHFLAEFLGDELESGRLTPAMKTAAHESIGLAAIQIQQQNLAGLTPSKLEKLVQTLQALSETGFKLQASDAEAL
ncbi:MAG: hypothetical protein OJI67_09660 [Prosthecobacter sp.]|nr:hypothetical protein [Prosthecobacter sp.]